MSLPLTGRVTLVTGASRGIGYFAAKALAEAGSDIIAIARTQGGLEALDDEIKSTGQSCTLVPMDLAQPEGIDRLGAIINERWGKLDGFLGNAAMLGEITPVPMMEPKTWDKLLAVNLTANYRLIRSLDPLLRASGAGRALFLTSGVAQSRRAYWGAYAATKSGLEALVQSYANEAAVTSLKVNLLNPGATRTAMRGKAMPGEDASKLPNPWDLSPLIVDMLSPEYQETNQIVSYRDTL